jgi:signal transduction histidine kinase
MPQPQLQAVNVNDIARQVVKLHEAQFQRGVIPSEAAQPASRGPLRSVVAKLELDDSLSAIDADPDLLHRALSNLVLNALDAMPDGGTLTLRTSATGKHVRLEVSDTGTGLTREECERLFTPYYTTKVHGTGLGLAIVQSVVSDHHGGISVDSTPGKGTTFRIDLPRRSSTSSMSKDMFKSAIGG